MDQLISTVIRIFAHPHQKSCKKQRIVFFDLTFTPLLPKEVSPTSPVGLTVLFFEAKQNAFTTTLYLLGDVGKVKYLISLVWCKPPEVRVMQSNRKQNTVFQYGEQLLLRGVVMLLDSALWYCDGGYDESVCLWGPVGKREVPFRTLKSNCTSGQESGDIFTRTREHFHPRKRPQPSKTSSRLSIQR